MPILLGILAGIGLPVQTSLNARLRKRVGSPYRASLVSFAVALLFLLVLLVLTGQGIGVPTEKLAGAPLWIYVGGVCGVIFLTGNILLLAKLGSVRAVVLPVLGQIVMGLVVDSTGLFGVTQVELTMLRVAGAGLVAIGVVVVSLAKEGSVQTEKTKPASWAWSVFGVFAGMLSAVQTAVNGRLGALVGSPIKASVISFLVGTTLLLVLCLTLARKSTSEGPRERQPWWSWLGGVLGGVYVLANVILSGKLGTGLTVIVLLVGATAGGLLVDHFGWFGVEKKPINARKALGVLLMIVGAAAIKLF